VKEVHEGFLIEGIVKSEKCSYTVAREDGSFTVKGGYKGPVDYTIRQAD